MPVEFLEDAVEEIDLALDWYLHRSASAARGFLVEVELGIERIGKQPELYQRYLHGARAYMLKRYPYLLVYRIRNSRIEIVAVAHAKRRPGYWRDRLE